MHKVIVRGRWSKVMCGANVGYSHYWTFRILLISVTIIPMVAFLPVAFSSFELFPWDKFKILSPTLSAAVRSKKKKQVTVNPTAAEAPDQVVAAPLSGAACTG